MANIVLAHGILGFGENPIGVNYFNGIKSVLKDKGHNVLTPSVDPLGSLEIRSTQLAKAIQNKWPDESEICVIAHSMGGLDTRRVIHKDRKVGSRIKKLITIATPHLGSPVADAVLDENHILRTSIPEWLMNILRTHTGAIDDLKTREELHDPDCSGVKYMEVVCVQKIEPWENSPLFKLTQAIGNISGPNDGVVPLKSASCSERTPIATWDVDHGGAIGWPSDMLGLGTVVAALTTSKQHIERYLSLVKHFD